MSRVIPLSLSLILCGSAFGIFSQHVVVSPENLSEHEDFKVWLYSDKNNPEMMNIILPFHEGNKKYWLVSCNRELKGDELNFRGWIWNSHKADPDFLIHVAPLAPVLDDTGKAPRGSFIRMRIRKDAISKHYIYHDFSQLVDDGGYFRTYKLSAFPIGESFDPLREEEMKISHFKRIGDNAKHREAEHLLREMLADEAFMAKWGQRYKAQQGGGGGEHSAIKPVENSEKNGNPESE